MIELQSLKQFSYFADLDQDDLRKLASITQQDTIPAGTEVFHEGESAERLYVIVRGTVEIRYALGDGRQLAIQNLGPGDLLVWSALFEPYKTTSAGTTKEETLVLAVDAPKLRQLLKNEPVLAQRLLHQVAKVLAERLETARAKFTELVRNLDDVLQRSRA